MTELPWVAMRKVSSAPFRGMVVVDSTLDHFLQNDGDPDALFQNNNSILKSSRSARSTLIKPHLFSGDAEGESLYVKEFRYKGAVHSLKSLFGKHRAQIMWQVSLHLLEHGIPVPQPEGYVIERRGPLCFKGWFISKVLEGCSSLDYLTCDLEKLSNRLECGGVIEALAAHVAALHDSGVTHGDLKWSNILIHEAKNELWFVDLDAAKLHSRNPAGKAVSRDLARFVLSGLEAGVDGKILARFLDHYAQRRNLKLIDIEGPMMNVLQKLRKRHEKKRQNTPS